MTETGRADGESESSPSRIPSLDGLRAVSIAMVIIGHAVMGTKAGGPAWRLLVPILGNGKFGVDVFFVISGFLITTLLYREREKSGTISLRAFYVRRAFRIIPAYYTYLLTIAILGFAGAIVARPWDFLYAMTFTWIYNFGDWNYYFAHSWSLSVEEQFYLLWPLALARLQRRHAVAVAVALIPAVPLAAIGFQLAHPGVWRRACYVMANSHADVLMSGCLLALAWRSPASVRILSALAFRGLPMPILATAMLASAAANSYPMRFGRISAFEETFNGAAVALALSYFMLRPSSIAARLLNLWPVALVGRMSYSLYLWQQLFFVPGRTHPLGHLQSFPLNLAAAAAAAAVSYLLIEKPALRLRSFVVDHRRGLLRSATPNSRAA